MPVIPSNLTLDQLIRRCRTKRAEILKTLAPELLAEYRRLGRVIRDLEAEEEDSSPVNPPAKDALFNLPRIPLAVHTEKVAAFLATRTAASRSEIAANAHVPIGSLSSVLKAERFEQIRRGYWALKKSKKG
jgi:hypothetical protein